MSFGVTWVDLEIKWTKLYKERQISYHLYVESKKNDANGLIYKTEIDSQT